MKKRIQIFLELLTCLCLCLFLFSCKKSEDMSSLSNDESITDESNNDSNPALQYETNEFELKPIDADEFLDCIGDIDKKYSVGQSENLFSEKDILELLKSKGFNDCSVFTSFNLDGEYSDMMEISYSSSEFHPVYETIYVSENQNIWSIIIIENSIFAAPVNYNYDENIRVPVLVSENDYIVSYDNETSQFFKVRPFESEMQLKVISEITAAELDKLSEEDY